MELDGFNKAEVAERYYREKGKFTNRKQATSNFRFLKGFDKSLIVKILNDIHSEAIKKVLNK